MPGGEVMNDFKKVSAVDYTAGSLYLHKARKKLKEILRKSIEK